MKNLGTSSDGKRIVARAVAEDNSGVVVEDGAVYEVRTSYPMDQEFIGFDLEHEPMFRDIYTKQFGNKDEAVKHLKYVTGYSDYEKRGPGF